MTYIPVGGLSVATPLYDLINDKAAPQTGRSQKDRSTEEISNASDGQGSCQKASGKNANQEEAQSSSQESTSTDTGAGSNRLSPRRRSGGGEIRHIEKSGRRRAQVFRLDGNPHRFSSAADGGNNHEFAGGLGQHMHPSAMPAHRTVLSSVDGIGAYHGQPA